MRIGIRRRHADFLQRQRPPPLPGKGSRVPAGLPVIPSPPSGLASRHQRQRLSPQTGFRGRNLSSQRHRRHRSRDLPPGHDPRRLVRRRPDPEKNLGQKKRRGSSRRVPGGIQRKRYAPARLPSSGGINHAPFSVSVTASGFFPALPAPRRSRPEQPRKSAGPAL